MNSESKDVLHEPTSIGAVIIDSADQLWVRLGENADEPWRFIDYDGFHYPAVWDEISVKGILSEGIVWDEGGKEPVPGDALPDFLSPELTILHKVSRALPANVRSPWFIDLPHSVARVVGELQDLKAGLAEQWVDFDGEQLSMRDLLEKRTKQLQQAREALKVQESAQGVEFNPMSPGEDLRAFTVQRLGDVSGTSGVGPVAKGVVFPDGTTVVQWQTRARSVVIYSSFVDALYIHGHGDQTGLVFDADPDTIHFPDGSRKSLTEGVVPNAVE